MLGLLEAAALGEALATTGLTPPVPASGAARRPARMYRRGQFGLRSHCNRQAGYKPCAAHAWRGRARLAQGTNLAAGTQCRKVVCRSALPMTKIGRHPGSESAFAPPAPHYSHLIDRTKRARKRESGSGPCAARLAIVSPDGSPRAALVLETVRVWALIREFRVVTAFASLDEALFEQKPGRPSHLRWPVDTSKLALSRSGLHLAESQRKHSGRTMASVGSRWRCDGTCGGLHQWLRWAAVDR
ncbi:uncharacterized protein TrAFT101_008224 [Trichoderma asperellum]|uniref:uncharacterized protein n=1 Tax=Trichoderma asperellum TaxID=101201 RepID=UPI0033294ED9|nr:hypothetical protein TrAFT101_008224 [Trichoderma asperellum]